MEVRTVDAQLPRRLREIAICEIHGVPDQPPLEGLELGSKTATGCPRPPVLPENRCEGVAGHPGARGQDRDAVDQIPQLAHVARIFSLAQGEPRSLVQLEAVAAEGSAELFEERVHVDRDVVAMFESEGTGNGRTQMRW